ncbi:MAG: transcription antitermination factor NusB [Streptococcaceae bacterium]|nr:transcription antitermination factor NusB [Streptococcaceae bacterium]MCL2681634.1 transcription antitermination factor NusB [Streptococcaceae bacterium]MCL2858851.1 transcription antitermination factor NusB [Streptococcaceae bacterium]
MPNTLNQHQIRRKVIQALFAYKIQHDLSSHQLKDFQEVAKEIKKVLTGPIKFKVNFKDERIIVRKFPKKLSEPLERLTDSYDNLDIKDFDQTALSAMLVLMRDLGGQAKKMQEEEAVELYQGMITNLSYVKLFSIDLEEEPVGPKVLEFLRALPKEASSKEVLDTFNQVFSKVHENILEKYSEESFQSLALQSELDALLEQAESKNNTENQVLLNNAKNFALNYEQETDEPEYFTQLVDGILNEQETIEATVSKYLTKDWAYERLTIIEKCLLSLGVYEITHTETPDKVAINEAIELSKEFSDDKSRKFINGILTQLIKK